MPGPTCPPSAPVLMARLWSAVLVLLLAACASTPPPASGLDAALLNHAEGPPADPLARARPAIDGGALLAGIRTLASDDFDGRAPGTRGETRTLAWLQSEFRAAGLKPAGDAGSWIQKVPMVAYSSQSTLTLSVRGKPRVLTPQRDFVAWSPAPLPDVMVDNSDLVFVGYGVIAPEFGWNDYKGTDLRGKTLLVLVNDPQVPDRANPDRLDPDMFGGTAMTYYGRWTYKYEMAARLGAAAVLIIHDARLAGYPWSVVVNSFGQENYVLQSATANTDYPLVPGWIEGGQAEELLRAAGYELHTLREQAARSDFRPVTLPVKARFHVQNHWRELQSANLIGRIPGSDPALRDEAVVYTAHWDHFGHDEHRTGDPIYHGAIDNASGVSGLIQIARAFRLADPPPRRSVVFIATTAEEHNQLGARWYVRHPAVPMARTVADLNIDGLNPLGRSIGVDVVGYGSNTLEDTLLDAALVQGREVFPELRPELGLAYRSDQVEFSRMGVPTLFMNAHPELRGRPAGFARARIEEYARHAYHTPLDVVRDDWDLSGAVEDLQLLLDVGYRTATRDDTPTWKPGAEFRRP